MCHAKGVDSIDLMLYAEESIMIDSHSSHPVIREPSFLDLFLRRKE
jgi:hypothetical protein